jgi:hypothetical protein
VDGKGVPFPTLVTISVFDEELPRFSFDSATVVIRFTLGRASNARPK